MAAIPLVDLQAQYHAHQAELDAAMQRVVASSQFIMGPDVAAFESEFAGFCQATACVGVASGTAALSMALEAGGIGPDDEVVTTAHTFIASAEAITAVGARPVFVDIDPRTYTLAPDAVAAAIGPRTRAIMPVHLYGQPADMAALAGIAQTHGLYMIEDAAQAHGARWAGHPVGAWSDAACFSFYPAKNLGAYGDAGAVTTNRPAIAEQIRLLRNHGRRGKYIHEIRGYGERMDTLQAAILRVKLAHLAAWTRRRQQLAARYTELLADTGLILPHVAQPAEAVWHLYVVRTPDEPARDALLARLGEAGIAAGVHYPVPLHLQPAYADLGYAAGDLPVTESAASTCVSLPLYPEMTLDQQDQVIESVRTHCASLFAQQVEEA